MDNKLTLVKYSSQKEMILQLIQGSWIEHNDETPTFDECEKDLNVWTDNGHALYLIALDEEFIGFAHLTSRGEAIDWIENLYIGPSYQGHGYGKMVLQKLEEIISQYSDSAYIEVAARNLRALKLYRENGYDCLNTITIRKDFHKERYETIKKEQLLDYEFEVRRIKEETQPVEGNGDDLFKKIVVNLNFNKKKNETEKSEQIIYRGEEEREFYLVMTKITDDYDEFMMDEDIEVEDPYGVIIVAQDYEGNWIAQRNYYMGWKVVIAPVAAKYVTGFNEPHWSLVKDGEMTTISEGLSYMIFENPQGEIVGETLCARFDVAKNIEEYQKLSLDEVEKIVYNAEMSGAK